MAARARRWQREIVAVCCASTLGLAGRVRRVRQAGVYMCPWDEDEGPKGTPCEVLDPPTPAAADGGCGGGGDGGDDCAAAGRHGRRHRARFRRLDPGGRGLRRAVRTEGAARVVRAGAALDRFTRPRAELPCDRADRRLRRLRRFRGCGPASVPHLRVRPAGGDVRGAGAMEGPRCWLPLWRPRGSRDLVRSSGQGGMGPAPRRTPSRPDGAAMAPRACNRSKSRRLTSFPQVARRGSRRRRWTPTNPARLEASRSSPGRALATRHRRARIRE